ncbi:hypothetical protein [Hungatella effluvii]|uniref:hypothetical protein n=1 Tax=Hungatella effluvii TaxID=1096246 RepID=UPI0022E4C0F1|nr:hypothetical protein [Hungatella effluvii]
MKRGMKKAVIISLTAAMAFVTSNFVYANGQALPNGTIVNQNGRKYLTDSNGEKYSGWFMDSKENWFYFNESDKAMKTGWHHDDKDGYWYYLNLSDGKMLTGWQTIDGKEYFFQPVRDMGNYRFNNEQEKWLYSINSKVPYGAMYVNTTTPDGLKVDNQGVKIVDEKTSTGNDIKTSDIVKNGWVSENGKWYYYNAGAMIKDQWLNLNGKWYYVLSDGTMVSNSWQVINGNSYYFGSDGAMYANTTTPDGKEVDTNGALKVDSGYGNTIIANDFIGEFHIPERSDGYTFKFFITKIEDGKIYGKYTEQGDHYIEGNFSNGVSLKNNYFTIKEYDYTYYDDYDENNEYDMTYRLAYKNSEPVIVEVETGATDNICFIKTTKTDIGRDGWIPEGGKWFYYENGTIAKDKWLNLNEKWYYVTSDGSMVCNSWKDIGGNSYYFGSDGAMYVNTTTPDGTKVDGNGIKIVNTNMANLNDFVGTYDMQGVTGPGRSMLITSISDTQICGAFYQIDDGGGSGSGLYSEFQVPLKNNKFTINGFSVDLEMGIAWEITGWYGETGTFESEFWLTYVDGKPAIFDREHHDSEIYLGKVGGVEEYYWEGFSIVSGEYWN